jgi:Zn-finger nucleic acid-binding protein
MDCPRCAPTADAGGPYRQSETSHLRRATLARERHPAGVEIDRCPGCGGTFLDHGELQRIEGEARDHRKVRSAERLDGAVRRAYARARAPGDRPQLACPSCGEEMFEREWGYGSQIMADVCIGCRGVWLDGGEIEDVEEFFAARG